MIERELPQDVAIVLGISIGTNKPSRSANYTLEEAVGLTRALGVEVAYSEYIALRSVHASKFLGGGKIAEIKERIKSLGATLLVVDTALSPIQQRNLERALSVKTIDRAGLILEIFGLRAATKEGRLQVEMARLAYERSRLVRTWTHLERQRGGQGFLAGPGETQIEADRRILNDKISRLKRQLERVRQTRHLQRKRRQRAPERIVALVGYTNVGKSTLFNILTEGGVLAKDMLFATLDTTHRVMPLPCGKPALLSDTVGFIADLPTDLITSFRATLEEVKEADLLIHVRDISDPLTEERKDNVLDILNQIEAGPEYGQPVIEAWNKFDRLDEDAQAYLEQEHDLEQNTENQDVSSSSDIEDTSTIIISCKSGYGIERLRHLIEERLNAQDDIIDINIPPQHYQVRAWLYEHGQVLHEQTEQDGQCLMQVQLSPVDAGKLRAKHPELLGL